MRRFLSSTWVALIVAAAVVCGGVAVVGLRGAFGAEQIFSETGSQARPLTPSHVKRVIYEVYGPVDSAGAVSYADTDTRVVQAGFAGLPWSVAITTTVPAVIASVVAQGSSGQIGCRISVDGVVKDERSVSGPGAQVSCLVKAA